MTTHITISNIRLEALPSKVFKLSFVRAENCERAHLVELYQTKSQLLKAVNSKGTFDELRVFLRKQFETGEIIK